MIFAISKIPRKGLIYDPGKKCDNSNAGKLPLPYGRKKRNWKKLQSNANRAAESGTLQHNVTDFLQDGRNPTMMLQPA